MKNVLSIPTSRIHDRETFHSVFAEALGFPDFYGRNMDAWIDCMTSLDAPEDGMTSIHVAEGELLTLHLDETTAFSKRCPELYEALVECCAFVNWRRIEHGSAPVLALSFNRGP